MSWYFSTRWPQQCSAQLSRPRYPFSSLVTQYTAANALLQSTTSLGIVVGPALSGIGIAALSSQEVLCVNTVTYLISAACLLPIHLFQEQFSHTKGNSIVSTIRDLVEGIRFAFVEQRVIPLLVLMAAFYTFGVSAFATLFPVFVRKMLDLGPVEVGYLWSALGAGLFLMSIALIWLTQWELSQRVYAIATSSAVAGAALCGLIWVSNPLLAVILMIIIGAGKGALTPIAWGVMQEITPRFMVGRVLSLYTTGAMVAAIAGMTTFGWITQEFGERTSMSRHWPHAVRDLTHSGRIEPVGSRHQVVPASGGQDRGDMRCRCVACGRECA